jgi:hypothetical protein
MDERRDYLNTGSQRDGDLEAVLMAIKFSRTFILAGALLGLTVGVVRTTLLYWNHGQYVKTTFGYTLTLADTSMENDQRNRNHPVPLVENVVQYLNGPMINVDLVRKISSRFPSTESGSIARTGQSVQKIKFLAASPGIAVEVEHQSQLSPNLLSIALAEETLIELKLESYPAVPALRDFINTREEFQVSSLELRQLLGDLIDRASRAQPSLITAARLMVEIEEEKESRLRRDTLFSFLVDRLFQTNPEQKAREIGHYTRLSERQALMKRRLDQLQVELTQGYVPVEGVKGTWPTNVSAQSNMLTWARIVSINILATFAGALLGFVCGIFKRALTVRRISAIRS